MTRPSMWTNVMQFGEVERVGLTQEIRVANPKESSKLEDRSRVAVHQVDQVALLSGRVLLGRVHITC